MFPSGNSNVNPILHYSSPSFHHTTNSSFLGLNGNQILLQQHQDQISSHYLASNADLIGANNQNVCDPLSRGKKLPMKKDRHSKILTSQGHRDRRVRLSIGVARKFFDLQDMLGFDKPSKTLDWLFTKSKLAIEELVTQMNTSHEESSKKSPSSISECDDLVMTTTKETKTAQQKQVKLQEDPLHVLARESRAKARARARERTIKKIWSQIEAHDNGSGCKTKSNKELKKMEEPNSENNQASVAAIKQRIHSSVLVPSRIKPSSALGFNSNLSGQKEAMSNYNGYSSNTTQYWDVRRAIMSSSLSAAMTAISTSSQVLQGFDQKAWESYHGSQI
uniref:Putative transcription factor n=1 Tax=Petunia hybrida TaxID=4102 RepID=G0ZGI7_PETHY|nr:TCP2 [Petunia x hybrida]AFI41911.1 putative transcription factor [Petunia x hybrida]